jgi:transposase
MLAGELDVVIGVDTHKHTHTAAAVSPTGVVLEHLTAPADPHGYRRLLAFGRRSGDRRLWAVGGKGTFGGGLNAVLVDGGERVVEVDRPQRPSRRAGPRATTSMRCERPDRRWPGSV